MIKNSKKKYGIIARIFHWLSAITIISLFALGLWMMQLNYYSQWYTLAPHYHISIGILLTGLILLRLFWRWYNIQPEPLESHTQLEKTAAHIAHIIIYILIFTILISGYLIPTADGRDIDIFNWFTLPSIGSIIERQEDIAGKIHLWAAYGLIATVTIHALAALKHHFFDRDNTLRKML